MAKTTSRNKEEPAPTDTEGWSPYVRTGRWDVTSCFLCTLLVPVAVLLSVHCREKGQGHSAYSSFQSSLVAVEWFSSVMTLAIVLTSAGKKQISLDTHQVAFWSFLITTSLTLTIIAGATFFLSPEVVPAVVQSVAVLTQCLTQSFLPLWSPLSFTFGEVCIISQALAFYLGTTAANILHKFELIFSEGLTEATVFSPATFYMEVAVLCCLLVATVLFFVRPLQCVPGFYLVFGAVFGLVAFPSLYVLLEQDFVSWTWSFITSSRAKLDLFGYWFLCSLAAAVIAMITSNVVNSTTSVAVRAGGSPSLHSNPPCHKPAAVKSSKTSSRVSGQLPSQLKEDNSASKGSSAGKPKSAPMTKPRSIADCDVNKENRVSEESHGNSCHGYHTRLRKLFHILAVVIFVPGALYEPVMMCVAGTCCLVVFVMMEVMRVLEVPPLGAPLQKTFTLLLDKQDEGPIILTHIYLLVGCLCPLWLYPINYAHQHLAMYSGVISLGVGDTAAAVIGSTLGRHRWPGTHRTVEGTTAAVLSQVGFVRLLQSLGCCQAVIWWPRVLLAILLTSMTEAYTDHIDNLILPLVMYSLLM